MALTSSSSSPKTPIQSKKKRANDLGVRNKGSRTYDSANGTTCHQCRQKTRNFAAVCKNWKVNRQCMIKLCLKCLQNRYGEKAEEVALLSDWNCPKCRDICNCSVCMKKRGKTPTGILVYTAKKSGFSSVSEMLNIGVVDNLNDANLASITADSDKKRSSILRRKGSKRPKISKERLGKEVGVDDMHSDASFKENVPSGLYFYDRNDRCSANVDAGNLQESGMPDDAGTDLPSVPIGQAVHFLEFCAAFGEALELRKGRAKSVLREVIQGKDRRRCQYNSTIQFHVQPLTLVQEDLGEKSPLLSPANESPSSSPTVGGNSWPEAFQKSVSESEDTMEALPVNFDRYAVLDQSEKLRLLNFLCDEALRMDKYLRDSIDDQKTNFVEKNKETYQKVVSAKDEEKSIKQKLHDEVAANIIVNEAPCTVSEQEAVAQIKDKLDQARAEMLEAMNTLANNLGTRDRAIVSKEEKWMTHSEVEKYICAKKLMGLKNSRRLLV